MHRPIIIALIVCIVSVSAQGRLFLTVEQENVDEVELQATGHFRIAIASDDKEQVEYDIVIGFFLPDNPTLGQFTLNSITSNAGEGADYTPLKSQKGFQCWSGKEIVTGEQFVFDYTPTVLGRTKLQLEDSETRTIIDELYITVTSPVEPEPMSHAFTYQGRLNEGGNSAEGNYDMKFRLYAAGDSGQYGQVGPELSIEEINLVNGYFSVRLDFGTEPEIFNGDRRWLEIEIRQSDTIEAFLILSPRHELTPAPYAINTPHAQQSEQAENADTLDGLDGSDFANASHGHSGDYAPTSHNHNADYYTQSQSESRYVNVTGDSISGNTTASLLLVNNTGTGKGISGEAAGPTSTGVFGEASNTGTGTNYGGYFRARGTTGRGVSAFAFGNEGRAVYGLANSTGDFTNYGGYFQSSGTTGHGVYGYASNSGDYMNYGGYFRAAGRYGHGVHGKATGWGGAGVYGEATTQSGPNANYGGYFTSAGGDGYGVYSEASGYSGIAVLGDASAVGNNANTGGHFNSNGDQGIGVMGFAGSGSTLVHYGGKFKAAGANGRGAYGWATGSEGHGVHGRADGTNGIGVYAEASSTYGSGIGVYATGRLHDFVAATGDYHSGSSIRWKSDVRTIDGALDKVGSLRGVYFKWDAEHGGDEDMGMIAEEVGQVVPEIVSYEENGIDATGMDYSKMSALLIEAVKELKAENEQLRNRIEALESQQ